MSLTEQEKKQMCKIADLGPRVKLPKQTCPDTLASFAMTCRVEFTPEQIARMEAADKAKLKARQDNNLKAQRKEKADEKKKKDEERNAALDRGYEQSPQLNFKPTENFFCKC